MCAVVVAESQAGEKSRQVDHRQHHAATHHQTDRQQALVSEGVGSGAGGVYLASTKHHPIIENIAATNGNFQADSEERHCISNCLALT